MMNTYRDTTYLMGKEIMLYRLPDSKKGNWYCRFKNPSGVTTYIRKSMKTASEGIATKRAIDMYNDMNAKIRLGAGVVETSWDHIIESFIDELSPRRQELARDYNQRYWKPFFDDGRRFPDLYKLNDRDLKGYWKFRINYWANKESDTRTAAKGEGRTSDTTLRLEAYTLKFFLVSAYNRNLLGQLPKVIYNHNANALVLNLPSANRRGRFDEESSDVIRRWWGATRRKLLISKEIPYKPTATSKEWNKAKDERVIFNHPYNRYNIAMTYTITVTVANTGIRPVEIVKLKWGDIEAFTDEDGFEFSVIQIRKEVSKVKKHRDAVARDFRETFNRLMEFKYEWSRYFGREPTENDYVFSNAKSEDGSKNCKPHQSIRNLLMKLGIYKQEVEGVLVSRTLYSFRSMYITERLKNGMDAYTLARACGTSIEMIERYYDFNKNIQFRHDITRHYKNYEFSGTGRPRNEE
jgi:integrase